MQCGIVYVLGKIMQIGSESSVNYNSYTDDMVVFANEKSVC